MIKFILQRLLYGIMVIFGVIVVVFFIFHALPGDPVDPICGLRCDAETRRAIKEELGLNEPLAVQLMYYINDLSPVAVHKNNEAEKEKYSYTKLFSVGGDNLLVLKAPYLRRSFQTNKRVDEIIFDGLEGTVILAVTAMAFATIFGIVFGVIAALYQNSALDHFLVTTSVIGISAPSFVTAILVSMVFGFYLSPYTGLNLQGYIFEYTIDGKIVVLKNLILPAFTLGMRPLSIIVQLTRSSMIEVLSQDYIRTATAKGLSRTKIIVKHALKNALNPVITAVSGWLASLMAGAFFVEFVFNWKGLGFRTIMSVQNLDLPVVMGAVIIVGVTFIFVNIVVDILYAVVDPRVRLE